jgi:alpha-D-ribose 1-methylphosphonate 5-triphosphate diphosphatase PhnM
VLKDKCSSRCEQDDMVTIVGPSKSPSNQSIRRLNLSVGSIYPSAERKISMATHTDTTLRCVAGSRAGRIVLAAFSVVI